MCGIFGYIGHRQNSLEIIIKGLQKLEYRGYDSWGVSTVLNNELFVKKKVGKISQAKIEDFQDKSSMSIGHTRWATHGGVSEINSHPHFSEDRTISVVHNGIIENYEEIRKELGEDKFISETDTEVIPQLIAHYKNQGLDFQKAVLKAMDRLEGRYAIVVLDIAENYLIAARRGSPLILGVGDGEYFLASDIPAFLEYTQNVNYLDDNEMVIIKPEGAEFIELKTRQPIEKRIINIDWKAESAEKGEFDHFMLKEIMEQKESINRAVNQDEDEILRVAQAIRDSRGCFLSGCGTAGKVCMTAEYFLSIIANRHVNFAPSSEFPIYHHFLRPESLLIVVSQSGETADVLEAMEAAKKKGCKVLSIVNAEGSTIARNSDFSLHIKAGPEKAVASTKAATSQMALLLLIAYAVKGELAEGRRVLAEAASKINDMLNPRFLTYIKEVAEKIKDEENNYIIGKAQNYPMALEAAIKIQEVSYVHAEGFAAGELKHGPIALITEGTPCISLIANDEVKQDIISNTIELKARGAHIIGISPENHSSFDEWIKVPDVGVASPLVNIIPTQLLAYYLSVFRGLDPDMPRNLAKSVTVK